MVNKFIEKAYSYDEMEAQARKDWGCDSPAQGAGTHDVLFDEAEIERDFGCRDGRFKKVVRRGHDAHRHLVRTHLLSFMERMRSVTAEDICGSMQWDYFSNDEREQAVALICELATELDLPIYLNEEDGFGEYTFSLI